MHLDPNDLLFLYTDGITEAQDPEEKEFGEEGVVKMLTSNRSGGVEDLALKLENQIREFTKGAPPLDDSTLIFVRRTQ
jgi:sigma-B regulation protein RsbU (phosphoserine phosphatase)